MNNSTPARARTFTWPQYVALLICALSLALLGPGFARTMEPVLVPPGDFFQDWASARNLTLGRPIYGNLRTAAKDYLQLDLSDKVVDGMVDINGHPPTSVWLALPLAQLEYRTAFRIWDLASLGLVVASLVMIGRELGYRLSLFTCATTIALALLCNPLRQLLAQGQFGGVLLFLLTTAWAADRKGRGAAAGICVALATAIKLYPGLILAYWLLAGRWSQLKTAVLTLVAIAAATVSAMGFESLLVYVRDVMPGMNYWYDSGLNVSLTGYWHRLFHGPDSVFIPLVADARLARLGTAVSSLAVLVVWGAIAYRSRRDPLPDQAWTTSLLAMTLLSPLVWDHSLVVLALPLALAWRDTVGEPLKRTILVIAAAALWLSPVLIWRFFLGARFGRTFLSPTESLTLFSFQFYSLTILFAVASRQAWIAVAAKPAPRRAAPAEPAAAYVASA